MKDKVPKWTKFTNPLPRLHIDSNAYIEDCTGLLQVDFANK